MVRLDWLVVLDPAYEAEPILVDSLWSDGYPLLTLAYGRCRSPTSPRARASHGIPKSSYPPTSTVTTCRWRTDESLSTRSD